MPELPEIETILRSLGPLVAGRTIAAVDVRQPTLRRTLGRGFAASLAGRTVVGTRRRAKYLLLTSTTTARGSSTSA